MRRRRNIRSDLETASESTRRPVKELKGVTAQVFVWCPMSWTAFDKFEHYKSRSASLAKLGCKLSERRKHVEDP